MVKVGIVGAGAMAACHIEAYQQCGATMVALVNRSEEKAKKIADGCGAVYLDSLEKLEKGSVDLLDICLPNYLHKEAILAGLKITPNILCEKPICLSNEDLREIEEAVAKARGSLMVAQVVRFWDSSLAVQEEGSGKPLSILCKRRQKKPQWTTGNWLFDKNKSGGIIYELAIHDIDFVVNQYGMPKKVSASQNDLNAVVNLEYDGFTAVVFASWAMPEGYNEGMMETYFEILGEEKLVVYDNKRCKDSLFIYEGNRVEQRHFERCNAYEKEMAYFLHCVETGEPPVKSNLQSVKNTMLVLQKCKEEIGVSLCL